VSPINRFDQIKAPVTCNCCVAMRNQRSQPMGEINELVKREHHGKLELVASKKENLRLSGSQRSGKSAESLMIGR
jgi:hypothetical protein